MELACGASVGRFVVLFSNYNDARVAVASLPLPVVFLPPSTQRWLVGVSHGFLIAGNRERHMVFLL